jgi:hypothetical protein
MNAPRAELNFDAIAQFSVKLVHLAHGILLSKLEPEAHEDPDRFAFAESLTPGVSLPRKAYSTSSFRKANLTRLFACKVPGAFC